MSESAASSYSHADQVFYDLHYRASIFYLRNTSRFFRSFLELFWMLLAVSGFAALILLHLAFVFRGTPASTGSIVNVTRLHPRRSIPTTCLASIPGFNPFADATHLVLIEDDDVLQESFAWELGSLPSKTTTKDKYNNASCVDSQIKLSNVAERVQFSFAKTKSYALLSPDLAQSLRAHGITAQIVAVSKTDSRCFGESFLQEVVFRVLGPDLVMMNWLLAISNGTGFVYNPRTDESVDLRQFAIVSVRNAHTRKPQDNSPLSRLLDLNHWHNWAKPWTSKFRTAIKTCLIYFISTNLVSFLLRVAQERLLELSLQIRSHQQESRSIIPLFVTHVADCFVFVPITVGVLFYLREFYQGNWVIALTVLAVVFLGELFSFVSVRTAQGIFFFPRAFFLLFCLVHFYLFSFPFGFANVAMGMIVCFILQCLTFFWNRYEVPAVARRNDADIGNTGTSRHHPLVTSNSNQQLPLSLSNASDYSGGDPFNRTPDSFRPIYLQPAQSPIHYTYSRGEFSQGRMSRASSEAIFQGPGDADDGSESCLYLLSGEVVIRGSGGRMQSETFQTASTAVNNRGDHSGDSTARLVTYDSMSTLQSTVAQLGTITDDPGTSSLQAIYDLNYSSPQGAANVLNPTSSMASFSTLDSARLRNRGRHRS